MTPFQEQSLVRQLKALRATPLPAGFEQRLLERLEQERQPGAVRELPSSKRGRGKLVLLAAIFVPFAAAASEMAWRAIESARAQAQFADAKVTPIKDSYTPLRNPMLAAPVVNHAVNAAEPEAAARLEVGEGKVRARSTLRSSTAAAIDAPNRNETSSGVTSQGNARIEKLTPNWNRVSGAESSATPQSVSPSMRLPALGTSGAAADNRNVERRNEMRTGERHGAGAGEQRDQRRERLRLGQ